MSGLNQRFTKPSSLKQDREFESHRLRKDFREAKALRKRANELLHLHVRFEQRNHILKAFKIDELVPRQNFLTKKF